jgi:hypothetical protein
MGKLVIKFQGRSVSEVNLKLGDTTIGRKPGCDIILGNDKSVSSTHAVIKTVGPKSTVVDLDSTNGTFIEGKRIKQHELKNGETILIGEHELIYRDVMAMEKAVFGQGPSTAVAPADTQEQTRIISASAQLLAVEGKDTGKRVSLMKSETTIDNPGKNPARIYRGADGYVLSAQLGPGEPRINDKPVPPGGQLLANGDIIEVAGTKYRFVK